MDIYAKQAMEECSSEQTMVRQGGINGKPFWNVNSSQFMYAPSFCFPYICGVREYIFTAKDCKGNMHRFTADKPTAPLAPIWKELEAGMVELTVEAVCKTTGKTYLCGGRTFCKISSFPGRAALPKRTCSYKECATKAFRYVFNDEATRYWLTHGVPKPDYYHNVYPSKMISSIIKAMIAYAELEPEHANDALLTATRAADYLLSITYGEDSPLCGLPPTYSFKGMDQEMVASTAPDDVSEREHQVMMIYPAFVGSAYCALAKATGNKKYYDAAIKIAEYYKHNVLENGSWPLLVSEKTGKSETANCCLDASILLFLSEIYAITGEECWHSLENNYFSYIRRTCLDNYNWEAQFEDTTLSCNYSNLSHINAGKIIEYIVDNLADDTEMLEEAIVLMRYIEDQFVVWGDFAPWSPDKKPDEKWYSPAALEQYYWYVPIDGSTARVIQCFLKLYSVTGNELYLEKARALGDSITRMQNKETGVIPTHWITTNCSTELRNFWINCHIGSSFIMFELAKAEKEI
ncbi:MAG: hypothetical protein E7403_07055 [Ruminococcaceae bacterium]|nr:hypothetical protein [Oscillospiraceae bacterium]